MKENILSTIKSFEYDKNRSNVFGIKSAIIWGHSNKSNSIFPILYISKPKHITQEDFEVLLDSLNIELIKK